VDFASSTSGAAKEYSLRTFSREDDVNGIPSSRAWAIEKHVDSRRMPVNEARRGQCRFGSLQIGPTDENINILGVARRRLIDFTYPRRDGVPSHDRVRYSRRFQSLRGAPKALTDFFHRRHHPFPGQSAYDMCVHGILRSSG
jgi:hypothetical protein